MKRPLIIGIGGTKSGSGKTALASAILKFLIQKDYKPNSNLNKQLTILEDNLTFKLRNKKSWGAIKFTKTEIYSSIIDDPEILNEYGKDTQRLIQAGAEVVLWVKSPVSELPDIMPIAIDRLYHLDGIIVEGNSAIRFSNPDITIVVSIENRDEIKPSVWLILEKADIIVMSHYSPLVSYKERLGHCKIFIIQDFQNIQQTDIIREVINYMDKLIDKKRIGELLIERSINQKISCANARSIAEELRIPYSEVGKIADELKIKIKDCQLGCF